MANNEPGYVYIYAEEHRNASGAYQGAKCFSYNGKVLDEIRKEKEMRDLKLESKRQNLIIYSWYIKKQQKE